MLVLDLITELGVSLFLTLAIINLQKKKTTLNTYSVQWIQTIVGLILLNSLAGVFIDSIHLFHTPENLIVYFKYNGFEYFFFELAILRLAIYCSYIYTFDKQKYFEQFLTIAFSAAATVHFYEIFSLEGNYFENTYVLEDIELFYLYLQLLASIYISYVIYKSISDIQNNEFGNSAKLMFIIIVTITISSIYKIIEFNFLDQRISQQILLLPSAILFLILHLKNPKFIFALPINIEYLTVANKDGLIIKSFSGKNENENSMVLSSVLSATNSLLSDFLKSKTPINSIQSNDMKILVHMHQHIIGYLVVKRYSQFINESLVNFVEEISKLALFDQDFIDYNESDIRFRTLEKLVEQFFPYLDTSALGTQNEFP